MPSDMAVIATRNQFSPTMPAAMKTPPHTGGVMVDKSAYQNTNKCTVRGAMPRSINAGPATDTQIT